MTPKVLIVDDEKTFRLVAETALGAEGYEVRTAATGREALLLGRSFCPDLVVLDRNLPDADGLTLLPKLRGSGLGAAPPLVVMATAYGEVDHAVQALKLGAHDYLTKPIQLPELTHKVAVALRTRHLELRVERLEQTLGAQGGPAAPFGDSPAMVKVSELIDAVAQSPGTTVLVEGESGSGKQIVARRIHDRTVAVQRSRGGAQAAPFIELNAAALPEPFVESELFGYERGAFTDAKAQKPGLIELADGGSLFLDEIGELSPSAQAKLLKVLETGSFRRLGGVVDVRVSLRFIAATHRDLPRAVQAGSFRQDLFHRLDVFRIQLPPLRERPDDVLPLARAFLAEFAARLDKRLTAIAPLAEAKLQGYRYPGNVRELRNVIERAAILSVGPEIEAPAILLSATAGEAAVAAGGGADWWQHAVETQGRPPTLAEIERAYLLQLWRHSGGNKSLMARLMGVSFPTVGRKLAEYGIER